MKKTALGMSLLAALTLAGCSSNDKKEDTKVSSSNSTTVAESSAQSSKKEEKSNVNVANLDKAAQLIEEKFNSSEGLVKVTIKNDVADDTSDLPHSVIEVKVIDDEARKNMEETQNAINANSATEEQKTVIYGVQLNVEEVAKTLENENDLIKFVVPTMNGNDMVIAMSNKNENIIPLVM